ncbi:hypothetical protein [Flavobacterium sp.]|uniref:GAP1-N1 domain-containing protein n=1 Tax=Flavobacterium sp. TaxID=239 RepID=UPI001211BA80|nr:hypothetical protein [Flavobacterium sp.]RZJ71741.1 MAG: hypothetical protein EOO49_08745 [Flavobacterium sp.]
MQIRVEQAFYGDVGKSHACIVSTISEPSLNSFLTAFTDRPGALSAGIVLEPYLSAAASHGKYILTKTYPDLNAARGGMVFTHALIIDLDDLVNIKNLTDLLSFLAPEISNSRKLEALLLEPSATSKKDIDTSFPRYAQDTLQKILEGEHPVIFAGNLSSFEDMLTTIWAGLPTGLKKNFSFTTGFSTTAIDRSKTIIYFQENLRSLLKNVDHVDDQNKEKIQIISEIERFILFKNDENAFEEFVKELNVDFKDWSIVAPTVKAFQLYQSIDSGLQQDELRLLLRNVAKISPKSDTGIRIKKAILDNLAGSISNNDKSNIKSLKNLPLESFTNGSVTLDSAIQKYLATNFNSEVNFDAGSAADLVVLSKGDTGTWWTTSVKSGLSTVLKTMTSGCSNNVWQLLENFDICRIELLSYIPSTRNNEQILFDAIPSTINIAAAEKVANGIKGKKWYSLYARLLLRYLPIEQALKKQLAYERSTGENCFEGTLSVCEKFDDTKLLTAALEDQGDLLCGVYADRSVKKPSLLNSLDTTNPIWLNIWSLSLKQTSNLPHGIDNLKSAVEDVIGFIAKGQAIPQNILSLISDSQFSDLSDFPNRGNLWKNMPDLYIEKFMRSTVNGCMDKMLLGNLAVSNLEIEILEVLRSELYVTEFLSNNRSNIGAVLTLYSNINGLKDSFLSDFINYYGGEISDLQSSALGDLILTRQFKSAAWQVFEKAKRYSSFKIALNKCKSIVRLDFYDTLMHGHLIGEKVSVESLYSEMLSKALSLYPEGPDHSDIWKRAGGDSGKFTNHKSREDNWRFGITLLKNGGGGDVTVGSLLEVMIADYPQNTELNELKKYIK